ncbi:hypothetical protein SCHPADRAFT_896982, partial [Schizopora paradoxa]
MVDRMVRQSNDLPHESLTMSDTIYSGSCHTPLPRYKIMVRLSQASFRPSSSRTVLRSRASGWTPITRKAAAQDTSRLENMDSMQEMAQDLHLKLSRAWSNPNGEAPELVLDPILPQGPTAGGDLMPIQSHEFHGPLATIDEGTEAELDAPPGGLSADGNPSNNPPFPGTPPIAPPSGAPVFIDPAPDTSILTRNYFFGQPNIHAPATAGHDLLYRISPQLSNAAQAVIQ